MSNIVLKLAHGNPDHDNMRNAAARDLLPGELDFNATTGAVMVADRGATEGKEWSCIVQNGSCVLSVPNPDYNASGSTDITQNIGADVYVDLADTGEAFDADTNPYEDIVYADSYTTLLLGTVADFPVRVTEPRIHIRFEKKLPSAPGAAAT